MRRGSNVCRRTCGGNEGKNHQAPAATWRRLLPLPFMLALAIQTIVCGGTTTEEDAYVATGGSYDVNASGHGAQAAPADVNATTIGGGALASGTAAATDVVAAPDGAEGKGVISLASPLQEGLPPQGPRGSLRAGGSGRRMMQNHRQEQRRRSTNPTITVGTLGKDFNVKEKALSAAPRDQVSALETLATPPVWNSSLCMAHWGLPHLQSKPDSNGYLVYVSGREQLANNRFLVADGIFVAKALNRTFVEYPVKDSLVVSIDLEDSLGLGAYWSLSEMCMYHRILDLRTFRSMVSRGSIPPEAFITVTTSKTIYEREVGDVRNEMEAREHFKQFSGAQVLSLEQTWKSNLERDSLQYLRPNPFYMGIVQMLLERQEGWAGGQFLAVQWRTEVSFGDLSECYKEVKSIVEEQRIRLGYGTHQVLFNTDLYGKASHSYKRKDQEAGMAVLGMINEDYPQALHNELHHFLKEIVDAGVRAVVSGLAVASSEVMIGSSFNPADVRIRIHEASRCQKPHSGYVTLIKEWRDDIFHKPHESMIRLFPFD
ncbi:unnamed protein product [Pylaiella littoralis]